MESKNLLISYLNSQNPYISQLNKLQGFLEIPRNSINYVTYEQRNNFYYKFKFCKDKDIQELYNDFIEICKYTYKVELCIFIEKK